MAETLCFTCKTRPAGNETGGPHSAYCGQCQPRRVQLNPTHCQCGTCRVTFATLESFEAHLIREPGSVVVTGCREPSGMGLVADDRDVWRTPEGLARRNLDAARLASLRGCR